MALCICTEYPAQSWMDELTELRSDELEGSARWAELNNKLGYWYQARAKWQDANCRATLHLGDQLLDSEPGFAPLREDFEEEARIARDDEAFFYSHRCDVDDWYQDDQERSAKTGAELLQKRYAELDYLLGQIGRKITDPQVQARLAQITEAKSDELRAVCSAIYATKKSLGYAPKLPKRETVKRYFRPVAA